MTRRLTARDMTGEAIIPVKKPKIDGEIEAVHNTFDEIIEKLAHYEDLEEAGRLITLPCAVGSLVWEIGIFDTGEEAGLFRAKPFALSDMEWDRLGNTVFLTLDEAIQKWKEIDTFGGFAEEIANVEAALKGKSNEEIDR